MAEVKLPEGWVECYLGDALTLINGRAYKQQEMLSEGTPILRIQNLNGGDNWFYSDLNLDDDKYCQLGDLLYAWSATFGPYWARWDHKVIYHYHIWKVLPSDALIKSYAYYELLRITGDIKRAAHGVAMPHITKAGMERWNIVLPPPAEQKAIVERLDSLLAQVATIKTRLDAIPALLKRFRQSLLSAAVSGKLTEEWRRENRFSMSLEEYKKNIHPFKLKAKKLPSPVVCGSWLSCKLGHVISVKSGDGLTAKEMVVDGSIPVYGGNGITGYHDRGNIDEDAIVIGRVGFYCGSIHHTEEDAWITDNALIVDFSDNLLLKRFVYWLLMATNLREDTASSAQPVISGSKIYPIDVLLPPIQEQTEIVRRVEQLFAYAESVEQQVAAARQRVNQLTQAILAKAFSGELTADWRAAHPELISGEHSAAALLARIQAERAASAKPARNTRRNTTG